MRRFLFNWGIKGIGIILLIILLRQIDFAVLLQTLRQFNWCNIFILEVASALVILTKAYRFQLLAGHFDVQLRLSSSTIIYGSGMFLSTITPGRLGDFAKVFYLKNSTGCSYQKGIYLSFMDRIFDLITLTVFALFGLAQFVAWRIILIFLLIFIGLVLLSTFLFKNYLLKIITRLLNGIGKRLRLSFSNIEPGVLVSSRLILPLILSLLPNGIIFYQMIYINQISQIAVTPLDMIGILAFGNLISMLPITISGLGTRDATFVYLLAQKGIASAAALSLSLSFFLFNNLGILFFGMILFLIFKPQIHEPEIDR